MKLEVHTIYYRPIYIRPKFQGISSQNMAGGKTTPLKNDGVSNTGRTLFLTPGTQKLPHPNGTQGYPRQSGSYPRDQILLAH